MIATQPRQTNRQALEEASLHQLHATAHNGLSAALHLLTDPSASDVEMLRRALGRAMRATTALKRACALAGGAS